MRESISVNVLALTAGLPLLAGCPVVIAAGDMHSCVRFENGTVKCWGEAEGGSLGYGNRNDIGDDEPVSSVGNVPIGQNALLITAGNAHTCALTDSLTVRCWGSGSHGELGYASIENVGDHGPAGGWGDVRLGQPAIDIAAGGLHTCALTGAGGVRCWGEAGWGALGYGNINDIGDDEHPEAAGDVQLGTDATQVAAGGDHSCALMDNGDVRCWGSNDSGQLGVRASFIGASDRPVDHPPVALGGRAIHVAAGYAHTCAVMDNGDVRCWGLNQHGELGYGNTTSVGSFGRLAGRVQLNGRAAKVTTGTYHSCALLEGGAVQCWGRGNEGQLGYGNRLNIGDDEVPSVAGTVNLGGNAVAISAGGFHTCAALAGEVIRCWGRGASGELGHGNTTDITAPGAVAPVPVR